MKRTFAGWLAALCLCHGVAHAQGTTDLESLLERPVVSAPSKGAETADVAPAVSSVITAEDLRRYGIRSLDEALKFLSLGVAVTSPLHAVEVGTRGVLLSSDYGSHMLLLVDGHAVNEPWNGTAYFERGALVPLELIDHIEVLLGPGSVLYGSQAMFGVINVVTKRARDYTGVHVIGEGSLLVPSEHDGRLRGPGSSGFGADLGTDYRLAAGIGKELRLFDRPAEIVAQLEYFRRLGPAYQLGPQDYGEDSVTGELKNFGPRARPGVWGGRVYDAAFTEVPALLATLRVGESELMLRAGMYRRGVPYQDSIVSDEGLFDDPQAFERDRNASLELRTRATLSRLTSLDLRLYADFNRYDWHSPNLAAEDCPDGSLEGCVRDLIGVGKWGGSEARLSFDIPGKARARTVLGIDARISHVRSDLNVLDRATGQLTATENDYEWLRVPLAAYLEQSLTPLSWLDVNLGARLDYVSDYDPHLSPRGALGITPWENGRLKLIYSEAFRSASSYERYYADPNIEIAAPNLKPERERSVELYFEQRFGLHRIGFGVFRSRWYDLVQNVLLSEDELAAGIDSGALSASAEEAYVNRNAGFIDNYGFNGGFDGRAFDGRFAYGLNATGAYTRIDAGDGSAPLQPTVGPQYFGNARVAYRLGALGSSPWLGLASSYQAARPTSLAFESGYSPPPQAPAELELKATLSGGVASLPGLGYRFGISYAFHRHGPYLIGPLQYAADPNATPELSPIPRLSAFVGLSYTFGASAAAP